MFAYIKGLYESRMLDYIVLDVNGIGYKVFMSENSMKKIGELGTTIKVYTYVKVREDDISIYGFSSAEELRMFELLISVSGVGAKSAISMLSNISPSSFALAVISNDTTKLVKIPGIGAKTAARIVLELKDKLKTEETINNSKSNKEIKEAIKEDNKVSEAISALQVLGYNKKEIEKAFEILDTDILSVEDLIRKGLTILSM